MGVVIFDGEIVGLVEVSYLLVLFEIIWVYCDIGWYVRCCVYLINFDGGIGKMGRIVLINDVGYIVVEVDGIYLCCVECCVVFLLLE